MGRVNILKYAFISFHFFPKWPFSSNDTISWVFKYIWQWIKVRGRERCWGRGQHCRRHLPHEMLSPVCWVLSHSWAQQHISVTLAWRWTDGSRTPATQQKTKNQWNNEKQTPPNLKTKSLQTPFYIVSISNFQSHGEFVRLLCSKTSNVWGNEDVTTGIFTAEGWQLSVASDSDLNTQSSFFGIPGSATVNVSVTVELPSVHLTHSIEWGCIQSELVVTAHALDCDITIAQVAKCITTHGAFVYSESVHLEVKAEASRAQRQLQLHLHVPVLAGGHYYPARGARVSNYLELGILWGKFSNVLGTQNFVILKILEN